MRTAEFWSVSVLLILLSPLALKAQGEREKAPRDGQELVELRQLVSQLSGRLDKLEQRLLQLERQIPPAHKPQNTPLALTPDEATAVSEIKKLGGQVTVDPSARNGGLWVSLQGTPTVDADLQCLKGVARVDLVNLIRTRVTGAGLEYLAAATNLRNVNLDLSEATDAALEHIKQFTHLQCLFLQKTNITDAGLKHLKGLTELMYLGLDATKVGDKGLEHLEGLTRLRGLYLAGTAVTDAGLEHLKELDNLRELRLSRTQVTDDGVKKLHEALPECKIER